MYSDVALRIYVDFSQSICYNEEKKKGNKNNKTPLIKLKNSESQSRSQLIKIALPSN